MKRTYKKPVIEKLEFDYINVVATSGLSSTDTSPELCSHNGSNSAGFNFENGSCEKDHSKNGHFNCY